VNDMTTEQEMSDNLNWLTTQNRNLVARVQQLEAILNAVQEQSPEALSFLSQTQVSEEMVEEVQDEERPAKSGKKEEKKE
tara:strand:+ start:434 stop:673 length:240 start_codon:yes stop_codon:yes gene_type:complete